MTARVELPAWVPADETKPAPMPLLVLQSFVNTWEADRATDLLRDDPPAAQEWFREAGLLASGQGEVDLGEARAFRESVRALLIHHGGGPAPNSADLAPMATVAERARLTVALGTDGGVDLEPADDAEPAALVRLLLIIHDAQRNGTWARLKACRNDECRWAYYDRSHAGRGAWCDMAVCGNRIKNRNLRTRRTLAGH